MNRMLPENRVRLVRVTAGDVRALRDMAVLTFTDTFGPDNTADDMEMYLQSEMTPERFAREISDAAFEIFFAAAGDRIIGYVTLHDEDDPDEESAGKGLKIERLYLLREFQGKKFGTELMYVTEEIARRKKAGYLWLGVWEKNFPALAFYEKNGFVRTGSCLFILGKDRQTDYIMKKYLNP
jgi:diamine N-acetyltransferase